jgi:nucleotide-binding universal stress UspA family protein
MPMKILICSDGMRAADNATQVGGLVASRAHAETTLLGIAEKPQDERALRDALEIQAQSLRSQGVTSEIVVLAGEPIRQILNQTSTTNYDLVVIGARRTGSTGLYWRSEKTYEVIKAIQPPVLVAMGECKQLKRFLVCTGGKVFIDAAVELTGKLAAAVGASVTLLHVMAEPPAIYVDLMQLEEDVDRLLESNSELGTNLREQKEMIQKLGVPAEVRLRHGDVMDEVFKEFHEGSYDLIVTGSFQARGMLRHYIMGNLTRGILNHADHPVLVARASEPPTSRTIWRSIKRWFGTKTNGTRTA